MQKESTTINICLKRRGYLALCARPLGLFVKAYVAAYNPFLDNASSHRIGQHISTGNGHEQGPGHHCGF
jgi:hypothetical protein